MATLDQERSLRILAHIIKNFLEDAYPVEMGFFLCTGPMGDNPDNVADYIGNIQREDGIKWLRETADRLEKDEVSDE